MCGSVHLNFTLPHARETNSPTKSPEKLKLLIWEPQLKTDYFPKKSFPFFVKFINLSPPPYKVSFINFLPEILI